MYMFACFFDLFEEKNPILENILNFFLSKHTGSQFWIHLRVTGVVFKKKKKEPDSKSFKSELAGGPGH